MKTKYIITALLCLICFASISAQSDSSKLFEKYADIEGVTSVYISKAMFKMMPGVQNAGLNLANMSGKIESLNILTTEKKELVAQMRKEFSQIIQKSHEELMRVRDEKSRTNFYANMNGDNISDLLMISDYDEGFTIIQLLGTFTLKEIQEITKDVK